jgi:hypothetical protein
MDRQPTEFDTAIDDIVTHFVTGLKGLSDGHYIRDGLVKQAITLLVTDICVEMPDQRYAVQEVLEFLHDNMPGGPATAEA